MAIRRHTAAWEAAFREGRLRHGLSARDAATYADHRVGEGPAPEPEPAPTRPEGHWLLTMWPWGGSAQEQDTTMSTTQDPVRWATGDGPWGEALGRAATLRAAADGALLEATVPTAGRGHARCRWRTAAAPPAASSSPSAYCRMVSSNR
jgi:hypothetical protein